MPEATAKEPSMKQRACSLACLILLAASGVCGQQIPLTDSPSTKDEILNLFRVMDTQAQVRQIMEQVMQQMRTINREQMKRRHPQITEADLARMDRESDEIAKTFPVDELIDDMVPVYQKHLTKRDVNAMIAFYSSPTGKKLLREMPAISAEGLQAVYPRMQENLDAILRRLDEQENQQKPAPEHK
jgi:hypothetical protein